MQSYGKAMTRSSRWLTRPQSDLLLWDSLFFSAELMNDFRIELSIDTNIRQSFLSIIKDNWVSFWKQGASRPPMLDFEFYLDTGNSLPVRCRQSVYGINKSEIMTAHIKVLKGNDWICDCVGYWASLLILAAKHHKEGRKDINEFIWHLCVNYYPLNSVTRSFECPIPRCTNSI